MSAIAKYNGAPPGTRPLDADGIEALRRLVPDDPIRLAPGQRACEGCGIAGTGPAILAVPVSPHDGRFAAEFNRCSDCAQLDELAGDETTRNVLYALAVVGIEPPADPTPLVRWLTVVGSRTPWLNPDAPSRDRCNPYPWAHISLSHRTAIKEAYLLAMRSRVHVSAPALRLPPPWGHACLFCGIGSESLAPIEVARRGGRENAARMVWRSVVAQPRAFGARGPGLIDGFVCTTCTESLNASRSVTSACARAFEEHARGRGIQVPTSLGELYEDGHPVVIPGWAALRSKVPNAEPWAHIEVAETTA